MKPAWLLSLLLVSACQQWPADPGTDCTRGDIRLLAQFEQARAADCIRQGPGVFDVTVAPETTPINPSPWYAFDLHADQPADVEVRLRYTDSRHRYHPKQLSEGGDWQRLDDSAVRLEAEGKRAILSLAVPPGRTRVAAQEVFGARERTDWVRDFAHRTGREPVTLGESTEGRDLLGVRLLEEAEPKPLVILIGGQHPPEVPGVHAMRAFLDRLASAHPDLTDRYAFLIVPEMNPDGVARGHWRTNGGLVDLNRDWGAFTQPETRAVRDEILRLAELGFDPLLLLDFHATRRNVFYIPEAGAAAAHPDLAQDWLSAIGRRWRGEMPEGVAGHNRENPTAKTWLPEMFAAPAITVEYGDEVDRQEIRALAVASADALAEILQRYGQKDEPR